MANPTELTYEQRQERGTVLARRLLTDCGKVSEPGQGLWAEMWEIVDPAETEFVVALSLWEQTGDEAARERVADLYDIVLDAYREAAAAYRQHQALA